MAELDAEDGRLQGVEAEVAADERVIVFRFRAVHAQHAELFRLFGVLRGDQAAVARRAEVLRGEEAEAAVLAHRAGPAALVLGADRLGRILDHRQVVTLGDVHDRIHVGALRRRDGPG